MGDRIPGISGYSRLCLAERLLVVAGVKVGEAEPGVDFRKIGIEQQNFAVERRRFGNSVDVEQNFTHDETGRSLAGLVAQGG